MLGSIENLLLAVAIFVGGHFALSSLPVRRRLIGIAGDAAFRAVYVFVMFGSLVWAVRAYGAAPHSSLWTAGMGLTHLPVILMIFACILAVAGLTTRIVTMVGGEKLAGEPAAVAGIATVTRHPFLWAVTLWSAGHIAANGDLASVVFFGGFALLSLGGMAHIDHRRKDAMEADWGPIALTSSAVPFLAAIQGRRAIDWRGIGWVRLAGGIVLYLALLVGHPWIAGVAIVPEFLLSMFR